ncbi:MAG: SRPBCC family protein [Acidimicrobiia bacterium]|nr:SRPBCC family protein [Acidimicrobiia bacterium]
MSDTYTVQRSTTINASPESVYPHIVDFHNWSTWSPWEELDPEMDKTYSGPDSGVGAAYAWSGNRKVGQGSMEIKDVAEPSNVRIALEFLKPFKARNKTEFVLEPTGAGTEVTWTIKGRKTLLTRIMGIFRSMDAMIGPDFERGLARLKQVAEEG